MPGGAPFRTSKRVSANNATPAMTALAATNAITSSFANAHIIIASCRSAGDRSIAASLVCWWFQSNQASTILQPNTLPSQHDIHIEFRYEIEFVLRWKRGWLQDREWKSTRLNCSHGSTPYAVCC